MFLKATMDQGSGKQCLPLCRDSRHLKPSYSDHCAKKVYESGMVCSSINLSIFPHHVTECDVLVLHFINFLRTALEMGRLLPYLWWSLPCLDLVLATDVTGLPGLVLGANVTDLARFAMKLSTLLNADFGF